MTNTKIVAWEPEAETQFILIMQEQVRRRGRPLVSFKDEIWSDMAIELNTSEGTDYTVKQLKEKKNRLKTKWREYKSLLEHTGFGWDERTQSVTASNDVWASYLHSHPNARPYRRKGCPMFLPMDEIFLDTVATGNYSRSSTVPPSMVIGGSSGKGDDMSVGQIGEDSPQVGTRRRLNITSGASSGKKSKSDEIRDNAFLSFTNVQEARLACIQSTNSTEKYTPTQCMYIPQSYPDVPWSQYQLAVEAFHNSYDREIFMAFDDLNRLRWLRSLQPTPTNHSHGGYPPHFYGVPNNVSNPKVKIMAPPMMTTITVMMGPIRGLVVVTLHHFETWLLQLNPFYPSSSLVICVETIIIIFSCSLLLFLGSTLIICVYGLG